MIVVLVVVIFVDENVPCFDLGCFCFVDFGKKIWHAIHTKHHRISYFVDCKIKTGVEEQRLLILKTLEYIYCKDKRINK